MPRRISEPRPVCPECGQVVKPETAVCFGRARKPGEKILEGVYCSADCVLNSWIRGYPRDMVRRK